MKKVTFKLLAILFLGMVLTVSCTKDDDNNDDDNTPTVVQANADWFVDSLSTNEVKWFKLTGDVTIVEMKIEWSEFENHGENKNYTGDIQVSAYKLDGETLYQTGEKDFFEIDNGYADKTRTIEIGGEKDVLIKVELTDANLPGTFALKATGKDPVTGEIEYITVEIKDEWTLATIEDGEIVGFEFDATEASKIQIIWAEEGSPEDTGDVDYTAEIQGSAYLSDGETLYKQLDNDKSFENKDKSWSDNPKAIEVDATDKMVKVHMGVNSSAGTFAFKVIELIEL